MESKRSRLGIPVNLEFYVWRNMWQRCLDPDEKRYADYGGRGIKVCERWRDFYLFVEDMGKRPNQTYTIDRIDVNGNYEPGNCRWATPIEQARTKRNSRLIEINGETHTFLQWCAKFGVSRCAAAARATECGDWEQAFKLAAINRNEERQIKITIRGETRTLAGWCKKLKLPCKVVWQRITREKMTPQEAIETPITNLRRGVKHGARTMRLDKQHRKT